jgi:hypothetical protein
MNKQLDELPEVIAPLANVGRVEERRHRGQKILEVSLRVNGTSCDMKSCFE